MGVVDVLDVTMDFFVMNPSLKCVPEFVCLGSKLMWGVAYYCDYKSPYGDSSRGDREKLVGSDVVGDMGWMGLAGVSEAIAKYEKLQEDAEMRGLRVWCDKIDELSLFIASWRVDADVIKEQIDVMGKFEKLLEGKEKVLARLNNVRVMGTTSGGKKKSILEEEEDGQV